MKIHVTRQAGKSLTDLIDKICAALQQQFRRPDGDDALYWYPKEIFDDAVITTNAVDSKLYRIPYSIEGEEVKFGEPVEVQEQYIEVTGEEREREQTVMQGGAIRQSLDGEGWRWRCQIVQFGMSATRHMWTRELFEESLALWEGIPCFADHASDSEMMNRPERSIRQMVGFWSHFEVAAEGSDATLNIKPSAEWFRKDLLWAHEAGKKDFYGFSIFVAGVEKQVQGPDGKPARGFKQIRPISVDAVTFAAAGGYAKYALASQRRAQTSTGSDSDRRVGTGSGSDPVHQGAKPTMKELLAKLFKKSKDRFQLVRQSLVDKHADGVTTEMNEDQVAEAIGGNLDLAAQAIEAVGSGQWPVDGDNPQPAARNPQSEEIGFARLPAAVRESFIAQALRDSNLPESVQQNIRKRLVSTATLEDIQDEIEAARDIVATVSQTGMVHNPPAQVLAERADKYMIGLAKAFGLSRDDFLATESRYERYVRQSGIRVVRPEESLWNSIDPVRSMRRFYIELTGDEEMTGTAPMTQRLTKQANWLTSDFVELLAAVTGKRILRDYRTVDYGIRRVVTVKPISDFKTQRAILLGYFGDLPTVAQDVAYADASVLTDTEETYAVAKRGRIVPLTLETIANDDLGAWVRIVGRLGRAAARTLAKFVWVTNLMANPTLNADGLALFHASHNNLITDAFATAGLKNAITKLLSQTEPGSSEPMVLSTMNLTLAVPPGLFLDAQSQTDFNQEPEGNQDPLARTIRRLGITPVNVPVFTDANDWLLAADPGDVDIIELAFWNGMEEPEFFTQQDPTQGDAFGKDIIAKYKVRHIFGGAPVDHRGVVKASVV